MHRIRVIRRLDFTKQPRIDATYDEDAKILKAIQRRRGDQAAMLLRAHMASSQAEVREITLHQVHLSRLTGSGAEEALNKSSCCMRSAKLGRSVALNFLSIVDD